MKTNDFGNILQYLRLREGLSQSQLAKIIHVSPATIGLYEQGRRQPRRDIEEAIADYFNVSLSFLRGIGTELDHAENEVILAYRSLSEEDKQKVKAFMSALKLADDNTVEEVAKSHDWSIITGGVKCGN
jgi:transcriptional regulator with XRE-family HTH domain